MVGIISAAVVALLVTLIGTRFWIRFLERRAYGQFIRSDGPTEHHVKRGTPTMGGVVLIIAVVAGYAVSHLVMWSLPSISGVLLLGLLLALGLVGFTDDWIKISRSRSRGLGSWAKLALQIGVGVIFAVLALLFPAYRYGNMVTPASTAISLLRDIPWLTVGPVVAVIFMVLLITGFSNGTNLTDGLDGLLTGSAAMVFLAYGVVNVWQGNQICGGPRITPDTEAMCYVVRNPGDLAIIAVAIAAALFGFLWWNARPAKIFLGDTGSLAIGGAVAGMAILTRTELLVLVIGFIFVLEAFSVIAQVGFFKLTKGRRLLKMAPLHHHFEMLGWQEVTVVIRFWIIAGLSVIAGIGLFYAEWVVGL
ncbi:MAG: phospho-N-acetylmuramoyl-pentapeptide-transferase [Propionibacteriaceae bacterium]|jgi:phospho-N-acetylmuramoyl-pentapeptide-transferase|nr:phospho-N-acetylmuramoyl-pentapeptide-transferase [Propionibacteriaceae bacterium]